MVNDNYFSSKSFLDKLKTYEDAANKGKNVYMESDDLTDIAEYYHMKGDLDRAVKTIDYALEIFPGSTLPLVFKSRLELLKNNNPVKAAHYAEQIEDKSDLEYFYIKAEILIFNSEMEEADIYLKNIYRHLDDEEKEDFVTDIANLYVDYDAHDKAEYWLNLSTEIDSTDYRELKGRIAMGSGNYEECERIFQELIDENPYNSPYWNQLASSQFMRNNIKDSIESSEFSIAINPDDEEALLNKANGMFSLGNYEEALIYYKRFNERHQIDETGEILQGITLLNLDRPDEALEHFRRAEQKAVQYSVNLPEIYQEMAFTLSKLNRLDEALECVEKSMILPQTDKDELTVFKGHLLLEHGRLEEAQHYFIQAIVHSEAEPNIYFRIAVSVYDNGYIRLAYKMLKNLLNSTDNDRKEGYSYLAMCCRLLNKEDEFKTVLAKASKVNPMEAKSVLGDMFPQELSPEEYYNYYINNEII